MLEVVKKPADVAAKLLASQPLSGRRILIIVENLPVPFDRRVWQEATTLVRAGATVSVICPFGKGYTEPYEFLDGVHIYRHALPLDARGASGYILEYSAALFWQTVLAFRVNGKQGFDIIQGCNPPDTIFLVAWIFRLFGKSFVFDHHDINPELYEAKFGRRDFFWRMLLWAEKLTFKTARISIATNESYRKIAIERGGMKPENVFVVRSGPDLRRVKEVAPNPELRKGRDFLVGYVGVMGAQEGIDLLLDSVKYIVNELKRTDIQFCLVGGGPELEPLKQMAKDLGVDDYVTFTGRAPDAVLFEVLSTSDVCVNPDRVNEMNDKSTMNKILEYMAIGRPIVQFDVTEGRFSAGEASVYALANDSRDFGDKIVDLLDDPETRKRMGAIGRERVEQNLSWDHEVPKLIAAYQRAFGLVSPGVGGQVQQRSDTKAREGA
ncbi:glycosyltransferase family 4 protein [Kaistia dalseonensis]|uniref:Glycosyltransferase involved in cell wall biosynthesis n=1 Tax=Kaistia dalseonensis TaxID=410840 RepID=A0ABU0H1Z1_9HYPH|nr:glycosyltransferase family 4 protein [Kaistia dalseonensis]MCX5493765.1 glycosyltransferase family 4 protein [Kaistia dalseonensis]MDQ0436329.1 glycosyltransferase involved in cell wall biosynthesis [Kaistia dalseonensis]